MSRDPASDQLNEYKKSAKDDPPTILTGSGNPIANKSASLTVGPRGPLLIQDFELLDELTHFNRERIPERVLHAKGTGAFGYFEVTHDITKYTRAKVFSKIGKRTPVFARFSQGSGGPGSADLSRDLKGLAVKFYTEEGIWDLLNIHLPINFIRDPIFFPDMIHSNKKNPVTNLRDTDMGWDFLTLRPESVHLTMMIFSDRGIPDGYRHMDGFGGHAFKLVNDKNEYVYCKFVLKTDQKIKNVLQEKAIKINATDPNYSIRDLYNAIARGKFPSWTLYIQVMTTTQAAKFRDIFDLTRVWSQKEFPLIPVGKLVLNKNPENHFTDVEQAAFNPANMPPGIEASPFDKSLHARIFVYGDMQRSRLGANHLQLPINCPYKMLSSFNYQRDGLMTINSQDGAPNYYPNSFKGPVVNPSAKSSTDFVSGEVDRHIPLNVDDFDQARDFWRDVLGAEEKSRLVQNLTDGLKAASLFIIERAIKNFSNVDAELGKRLIDSLRKSGVPLNASGMSANF